MNIGLLTTLLFFFALICATQAQGDLVQQLFHKLKSEQVKHDQSLIPFIADKKFKGLYPSYVHLNFIGNWSSYFLRNDFSVYDNNAFVTSWITQLLLESHNMGAINLHLDDIQASIDVLENFKDHNLPEKAPIFDFWFQKLNDMGDYYTQWPSNLGYLIDTFEDIEGTLKWFLKTVGLEWVWDDIEPLVHLADDAVKSFDIPPDADDTSVTLGMIFHAKEAFPSIYNEFLSKFSDFGELRDQLLKNSYQPFSSDDNINSIDPRSYYWMRKFLQSKKNQTSTLKLITTWIMNIETDIKYYPKGVKMPFNANNIDASVCANSLYGLTLSALHLPEKQKSDLFTPEMIDLYMDTLDLAVWTLETDVMNDRPDLALLYYPPVYNFYWFISRVLFQLRSLPSTADGFLHTAYNKLRIPAQEHVTQQLLKKSQTDASGRLFWDDFLGDGDEENGKPKIRGEDRIYSTSVAVNALLDVWTVEGENCARKWVSDVDPEVKDKIGKAIAWLEHYIMKDTYAHENAFFSGSVKGMAQLPFLYPANRIEYFNGTAIPPRGPGSVVIDDMLDLVKGVIDEDEYQKMLQEIWFFAPTPTTFTTYNVPGSTFPYWSSPSLTYATTLVALSKHMSVLKCTQ
eukprot:TRINITY_DN925_c0_g2_i1.p1 TRINITY_DN925_c0_g2~~TRINITY_DN925_c0_g2_i1.p1  ORF type:complete len:626 (+),score=134.24 TRINITY_DN925_c0_g2_i1:27-1904(+)